MHVCCRYVVYVLSHFSVAVSGVLVLVLYDLLVCYSGLLSTRDFTEVARLSLKLPFFDCASIARL
jgi:hypothetical protein